MRTFLGKLLISRDGYKLCEARTQNYQGPDISCDQPRPIKGILVAMTVMNWTLVSKGKPAM
jgi:hypothetical protein